MGGRSSEHAISIASARSVLDALDPERYEVVTIEIDRQGGWQLGSGNVPELEAGSGGTLGAGEPPGSPEAPSTGPLRGRVASPPPQAGLPVPAASKEVATTLA